MPDARPICFMIMPYNTKPTLLPPESGAPAMVDFNRLWDAALSKAIDAAGYDPVRADQDIGASIIQEMIERLAISDLVVADLSIPNGNVYYEIGVRHAAVRVGCVLIAATWARPLFDLDQMRGIRYPLPAESIDDAMAAEIQRVLGDTVHGLRRLADGISPVWSSLPGYPGQIDVDRTSAFRSALHELSEFQAAVAAVRVAPDGERRDRALALTNAYYKGAPVKPVVAMELLYLLRDCTDWQTLLGFIESLDQQIREFPVVREQHALALSKLKRHAEAIGELLELVKSSDTSERRGLLGGRYKALFDAEADPKVKRRYLNQAIEHYELGMRNDLNDYFPTCNLPGLYRERGDPGDAELATVAAAVTVVACERAERRNADDGWLKPTLLLAAFHAGDVPKAQDLALRVEREGAVAWKLDTTLVELERATKFQSGGVRDQLSAVLERLRETV